MLQRVNRLPAVAFPDVKKRGLLTQGRYLSVLVLNKNNSEAPRFGIVVSTKISKLATKRNEIKRNIRSFIEGKLESTKKDLDVVILTKSNIVNIDKAAIHNDLTEVFTKAKII